MSHEIRTSMTAILGFTDLSLERAQEPELCDALQTIKRNGMHLLMIINDMLDLSKLEAGKIGIEHVTCSAYEVIRDVDNLMQMQAQAKGLDLEVEFKGTIPQRIRTDPTRLRQILINLIGNAIKFTESGKVQVITRLLTGDSPSPMLQIDVVDSGIGASQEKIEQMFQPFTQADTSTTRKFGGTGIGLTTSKKLAELLGGDIIANCVLGRGCCFQLTIATGNLRGVRLAEYRMGKQMRPRMASPKPLPSSEKLDCRILIAEDGPDNQRLISFILKKAGAQVIVVAENGQIALELAQTAARGGKPFDVILMDMQMPVLDGYEATQKLREAGFQGLIIALTAHAMTGDRKKCRQAGCDDYATKPIDRDKLVTLIRQHLESSVTQHWRKV